MVKKIYIKYSDRFDIFPVMHNAFRCYTKFSLYIFFEFTMRLYCYVCDFLRTQITQNSTLRLPALFWNGVRNIYNSSASAAIFFTRKSNLYLNFAKANTLWIMALFYRHIFIIFRYNNWSEATIYMIWISVQTNIST